MQIDESYFQEWIDATGPQPIDLLLDLVEEECKEVLLAIENLRRTPGWRPAKEDLLKEMCDVFYTSKLLCDTEFWDFEGAIEEVCYSNSTKFDADGKPILNQNGKVMKGPHYQPAEMSYYIGD